MIEKMAIAFFEISVDGLLGFVDASVVAVVNDRPRHAAENRLDNV
jgi:hypothetical protein